MPPRQKPLCFLTSTSAHEQNDRITANKNGKRRACNEPVRSDVTVICGGLECSCHGEVLTGQRDYFHMLCFEPFADASSPTVEFSEDDPAALERLLYAL